MLLELVVAWFVLSMLAAWVAGNKARSPFPILLLSLFLSPFVGLVVAFAMRGQDSIDRANAVQFGEAGAYRKCPACCEPIRAEAWKCPHCAHESQAKPAT